MVTGLHNHNPNLQVLPANARYLQVCMSPYKGSQVRAACPDVCLERLLGEIAYPTLKAGRVKRCLLCDGQVASREDKDRSCDRDCWLYPLHKVGSLTKHHMVLVHIDKYKMDFRVRCITCVSRVSQNYVQIMNHLCK